MKWRNGKERTVVQENMSTKEISEKIINENGAHLVGVLLILYYIMDRMKFEAS